MFSRRELEGEVDFSFFDSDCDDNSTSKDGGKELDKSLRAENESLSVPEQLRARHSQSAGAFVGGGTKIHPKQVEESNTIAAENKDYSSGSQTQELSKISTTSPVACALDKVTHDGGDGDVSRLHSKRLNETFITLLAESREVDEEDGYHQSQNESEDDEGLSSTHRYSGPKGRNGSACKRLTRKRHPRSPSPPSTEAGADSDTDSSCGSSDVSCTLEPLTLTKPKTSLASSSPRVRRTRVGSAGSRGWPASRSEECEDTVTDVTPLSTPDISPVQSLDLSQGCGVTETEYGGLKETQPESVPSGGLSNTPQEDENPDHDVDDCSISSESQVGGELVFHHPGGRDRKNYSFSNDEVRRIDRENQRLLRELSRLSSRPGSTVGKKPQAAKNSPVIRLSHSAINRQREQKRIERENLAFLKRLESVKPTPGMKCSEQLADYQRQARYLGASSYPIYRSTSKKERPSSKMPSGRSTRPPSAAHHGSRAVSATVDSTTAPAHRSKKASAPRPAWC